MRVVLLAVVLSCAAAAQASSPEQLFRDAVAAQQRGDDAVAIRKYQQLLKIRPDVAEARANLGAVLSKQNRFDEAIEQYQKAIEKSPANPALRMNLALAYYKKGDIAEAAKLLEAIHKANAEDLRVSLLLGDSYTRLKLYDRAVALLAPLESSYPAELGLQWVLGSALIGAGRQRGGLERVERVAVKTNNPEAWLMAARTALNLSEFERARDDADAALRQNPQLAGASTVRGTALLYIGDNPAAVEALKKALATNPNDFEAHLGLGAVLNTERDLEGARKHLELALRLNPKSNLALYEMARLERTEGKLEDAARDFEKVIKENPNWAQPHIELSALYFRMNRQEDGERERATFDRLNALTPKR